MTEPWWISIIKAFVIVNLVMVTFAYMTWLERKAMGRMQRRYGPNRAGPFGLLQPIADLIKLVRKEAFAPAGAIGIPYILAPIVSAFTALAAFSVIPFGPGWTVNGWRINRFFFKESLRTYTSRFGDARLARPHRSRTAARESARARPA